FCIIALHDSKSPATSACGRERISARSWPAQNAFPAPVITTIRTAGSAAIASSSRCRRCRTSRERALYLAGRLSVRTAMARESARRTGAAEEGGCEASFITDPRWGRVKRNYRTVECGKTVVARGNQQE